MPCPDRPFFNRALLALGLGLAVAAGQPAMAAADDAYSGTAAPVATDELAPAAPDATTPPPALGMSGQQVYSNVCIACHSPPGVGGAPALGDAAAWTPRIAQGMDVLIAHALNGFSGKTGVMPKKGERADLSDEEVIGAVKYMVDQVSR